MSSFDLGAIIIAGISLVGYVASLELRLRNVQIKLEKAEEKNVDSAIVAKVRDEPDPLLDDALAKRLSPGPKSKN